MQILLIRKCHIVGALDGVESAKRRIQEAIGALYGGITSVVITHRPSTIRNADVIHVIENGRIIKSGDWASLAAGETGRFRRLCEGTRCAAESRRHGNGP